MRTSTSRMNKWEKGAIPGIILGFIALVVLVLVGLGVFVTKRPIITEDDGEGPRTETVYVATSTVTYVATTTEETVPRVSPISSGGGSGGSSGRVTYTAPRRSVSNTASLAAYSGPAYRNPVFGLTIPGNYQVTTSQNIYGGVPATASYHFYTGGVYAYTINVFSKEQWNNIRIQETVSVVEQGNTSAYLGEGRYLGENKTWIFSYIPAAYSVPTGVRFY